MNPINSPASRPIPSWAWVFVLAGIGLSVYGIAQRTEGFGPALIVGSVAGGMGSLIAYLSLSVARKFSWPALDRFLAATAITLAGWILFVLVLPVLQGRSSTAVDTWQSFASTEGRFTVLMPGTPQPRTQNVSTPAGNITFYAHFWEDRSAAYGVAYSDFPQGLIQSANVEALLNGARDGAAANVSGTLVSERRIGLSGHPGREIEIRISGGIVKARIYLVGSRLYQLIVVEQSGTESSANQARFFDSFQLSAP